MCPYTATLFIVSVRPQGGEVRVSDSDGSRHWCGTTPTLPGDASGDAEPEPGATVKSLIQSFDTVGQSEHRAPLQHTHTHSEPQHSSATRDNSWPPYKYVVSLHSVVLGRPQPPERVFFLCQENHLIPVLLIMCWIDLNHKEFF